MTPPATAVWLLASFSCPKLIVRGSSAEQPNPARQNAATDAAGASFGSTAISANDAASRSGSPW